VEVRERKTTKTQSDCMQLRRPRRVQRDRHPQSCRRRRSHPSPGSRSLSLAFDLVEKVLHEKVVVVVVVLNLLLVPVPVLVVSQLLPA
jgi:hypothetical protein